MNVLEEMEMDMVIIDAIELSFGIIRPGEIIDLAPSAINPDIHVARRSFIGLRIIASDSRALQQAARETLLPKELNSLLPRHRHFNRILLDLLRRIPPMNGGMLRRILFFRKTLNGRKEHTRDRLVFRQRQRPLPLLLRKSARQARPFPGQDKEQFQKEGLGIG